jgi:hypothetical protein
LVWRIEYTNGAGARTSVEIPGVKANWIYCNLQELILWEI